MELGNKHELCQTTITHAFSWPKAAKTIKTVIWNIQPIIQKDALQHAVFSNLYNSFIFKICEGKLQKFDHLKNSGRCTTINYIWVYNGMTSRKSNASTKKTIQKITKTPRWGFQVRASGVTHIYSNNIGPNNIVVGILKQESDNASLRITSFAFVKSGSAARRIRGLMQVSSQRWYATALDFGKSTCWCMPSDFPESKPECWCLQGLQPPVSTLHMRLSRGSGPSIGGSMSQTIGGGQAL